MESMTKSGETSWQKIVSAYSKPDLRKSIWQIVNTLVPFFALFYLSMRSVEISLWLTVPLTILTAGTGKLVTLKGIISYLNGSADAALPTAVITYNCPLP